MINPYAIETVKLGNRIRYYVRGYWFRTFREASRFINILAK